MEFTAQPLEKPCPGSQKGQEAAREITVFTVRSNVSRSLKNGKDLDSALITYKFIFYK